MLEENRSEEEIKKLCDRVRETAYALHTFLRHGHLEKVYQNGLTHRLRKAGIRVEQRQPIQVTDEDGTILGDYLADLIVESFLIVELKACSALTSAHVAQVLGYLRGANHHHALLINFGAPRFEIRKLIY